MKEKLAKQIQLDPNEFEKWAQNIQIRISSEKATITADVPNVWICVNLLHGGSWYWDIPVVNMGGIIGEIVSYLGTWGMKEINCKTVDELRRAFRDNRKMVWGIVLYAHGSKFGLIANSSGKDKMQQEELMRLIKSQGFKLAKADIMQCYSGFNGTTKITYKYRNFKEAYERISAKDPQSLTKQNLLEMCRKDCEKAYLKMLKDHPYYKLQECHLSGDDIVVILKTDMGNAWKDLSISSIVYQGINALGIDWGFMEKNVVEINR